MRLAKIATAAALVVGTVLTTNLVMSDGKEHGLVSASIRWVDSNTWIVIEDAGHTSTGIADIDVLSDRLRVHFDECHTKVGSLQATPDEQFAAAGVRTGASVGLCHADVFFYMGSSATSVDPGLLSRAYANVWLTGLFPEGNQS